MLGHLWNHLEKISENKDHFIAIHKRLTLRTLMKRKDTKGKANLIALNILCDKIGISEYEGERLSFWTAFKYLFIGERALRSKTDT